MTYLNLKNVTSFNSYQRAFANDYNLKEIYFEKLENIPNDQSIFNNSHSLLYT